MSKLKNITQHILVCMHKTCVKEGAKDTLKTLKHVLKDAGLNRTARVDKVDCFDLCGRGPVVVVHPAGIWYGAADERAAHDIVENLQGKATKVRAKILRAPDEETAID